MMADASIITQSSIVGFTAYGMALLFIKAVMILIMAQLLAEQLEFSPASVRHTIWLLALISLAALPVLTTILPTWQLIPVDLPSPEGVHRAVSVESPTEVILPGFLSWLDGIIFIYLAVVVIRFGMLCLSLVQVGVMTVRSTRVSDSWSYIAESDHGRPVRIRMSREVAGPMTWGTLCPIILLPVSADQWTDREKIMVVRHEISHIRRADWLTQLIGNLVAILYWPVPGVYSALKSLSLEAERACDNVVLNGGAEPADYAALLVHQAKAVSLPASVALGSPSELSQRVKHIVSAYIDRTGERNMQWVIVTIGCALLLPLASVKAVGRFQVEEKLSSLTPVTVFLRASENSAKKRKVETILRPPRPLAANIPPRNITQSGAHPQVRYSTEIARANFNPESLGRIELNDSHTVAPKMISHRPPDYPQQARRRGIEGEVLVEFDINPNGYVVNPRIISARPGTLFNQSVIRALDGYRFSPPRLGGQKVLLTGIRKQFRFLLNEEELNTGLLPEEEGMLLPETIDSG